MSERMQILVVEDDPALRDAVCLTLEVAGHQPVSVDGGPAALEVLQKQAFSLVLSDLRMEPMNGLQLLDEIHQRLPQLPVILMTAYGDVEKAVAAMRGGACEFILKPFAPDILLDLVHRHAWQPAAADGMIAQDPLSKSVQALALKVADSDASVFLNGESGTGKEVYARFIHQNSSRRQQKMVAINCAAIPDNLLEATLFGYEKGAFTGAQSAQAGKFEQANGGSLLLDEVSEMPLLLQAKLLRVLQEREVERVGGKQPIALDIRILATSNRDLAAEVAAGRFREDLFYRLNVFPIHVPALRERPEDIVPLAKAFLHNYASGRRAAVQLTADGEALLRAYAWPGNVRELENTMQRAQILTSGECIDRAILATCLPVQASNTESVAKAAKSAVLATDCLPIPADFAASAAPGVVTASKNMKDLEREHILSTLAEVGGSRKKAVAKLGISERTLRYKLQQYRAEGFIEVSDQTF